MLGSGWADLVAIAAVVMLIFSAVIADRGGSPFDRTSTDPGLQLAAGTPATNPAEETTASVMYRGNAARTGEMPGPGPEGVPALAWSKQVEPGSAEYPIAADGRLLYLAFSRQSGTFDLRAAELATGNDLWNTPLGLGSGSRPTVGDGMVYVNTTAGLQALDASTGDIVWASPVNAPNTTISPVVMDGAVYNVTLGNFTNPAPGPFMTALDASDGTHMWSAPLPGTELSEVSYHGGLIQVAAWGEQVFGRSADGTISAFDARTGEPVWSTSLEGPAGEPFLVSEGVVAVTAIDRNQPEGPYPVRLHALDAATGKPLWDPVDLTSEATLAAANGSLFVTDSLKTTGTVSAYDIHTGESIWTQEMGGSLENPVYVDGQLYVSSSAAGTVQRVDAATGVTTWSVYLGAQGSPVVDRGLLIAAGHEFLYAVAAGETQGTPPADKPVDLSGLPPCEPPRTAPSEPLKGEPAKTIPVESEPLDVSAADGSPTTLDGRPLRFADWRYILAANVPSGAPGTSAQIDRVAATIAAMTVCSHRPESQAQLAGFFSDDFYRRGIVDAEDAETVHLGIQPDEEQLKFLDVFQLEDGRVAASTVSDNGSGTFLVFVEEAGHLLVDEIYLVSPEHPPAPDDTITAGTWSRPLSCVHEMRFRAEGQAVLA